VAARDRLGRDVHRGLGDPEHIDEATRRFGMTIEPAEQHPAVQRLAAEDHGTRSRHETGKNKPFHELMA
jgi:hypothetical protein